MFPGHARQLAQHSTPVPRVLEVVKETQADRSFEGPVAERQGESARADSPPGSGCIDLGEHLGRDIRRDHRCAPRHQGRREPTGTTRHVEPARPIGHHDPSEQTVDRALLGSIRRTLGSSLRESIPVLSSTARIPVVGGQPSVPFGEPANVLRVAIAQRVDSRTQSR